MTPNKSDSGELSEILDRFLGRRNTYMNRNMIRQTDDEHLKFDLKYAKDQAIHEITAHIQAVGEVTGETSDGYHTFNELYEYRMLYNAALFNEWAQQNWAGSKTAPEVWKSDRHNDGELCFGGGWFVVGAYLESGQITNHYEMKHWDLFDVPKLKQAPKWDGHTPQEAAKRLAQYLEDKE